MFSGIGGSEILLILLVVLLLFGSKRIPEFSRSIGRAVRAARRALARIEDEINPGPPTEPPGPGADKAG